MNARQLYFVKPQQVEIREQQLPSLQPGQVLIKNLYSGISAGTEMLVYRGQLPQDMTLDAGLAAFEQQKIDYPLQYGYACVGRIEQVGEGVDASCVGKTVFSFQPHASHHVCNIDSVIALPDGVDPKEAVFLANMETAVNLVQDGSPMLGERVLVLGQGIVGLLVSSVLAEFPLACLYAVESIEGRRALADQTGVQATFSPDSVADINSLHEKLRINEADGGADVVFELTGAPAALNLAVDHCAYSGRIVVGSWYGTKTAPINLGERFHRNRMTIVSSQVSSIAPRLSGRWDKARRFSVAWDMIKKCRPSRLISHCMPFAEAAQAYQLLDGAAQDTTQIIFDYQD
ncbi:MAG: zinc-binding dehydrogenase [Gammaproteobacteria bacterium]|nr:zinc-binding dehydrogenase [Gammaproteobacteria bacterium]